MIRERVWISGVLLVLAILLIVAWEKGIRPREEKKAEQSTMMFPDLEIKRVTKIEMTRGDKKDILSTHDSNWVVETDNGYPADPDGVQKALEAAQKLNCKTEAASGEDQYSRFELEKDKAMEIKLYGDKSKVMADFYIGKRGPTYSSTYFRKEGDKRICLAYENLVTVFDRTNDTWRDKSILSFLATDCVGLKIQDGSTVVSLEKDTKENQWNILEDQAKKTAASWAVDGICQTLSKLRTQGFPTISPQEAGLEKPSKTITVNLLGGKSYTLSVGLPSKAKDNFYVKRNDQPNIFELSSWQLSSLLKKKDDLVEKGEGGQPEPAPAIPPAAIPKANE